MVRYLFFGSLLGSLSFFTVGATVGSAWAETKESLEALIPRTLPSVVQKLKPGKTTRAEVDKLFGPPMKGSTTEQQYYQLFKSGTDRNDLTVEFTKKGIVRYYYYLFPPSPDEPRYTFKTFEPFLPKEALKIAKQKLQQESSRPEAGRTFDVVVAEKGLLLKFDQSDNANLSAVLSWKPGEKMP